PPSDNPSSVVTSLRTVETGVTHDRVATPLMITVHAPHCPRPQPNFGPWRSRSFRSTYSNGVDGSTLTVCVPPFTLSVIEVIRISYAASWRSESRSAFLVLGSWFWFWFWVQVRSSWVQVPVLSQNLELRTRTQNPEPRTKNPIRYLELHLH